MKLKKVGALSLAAAMMVGSLAGCAMPSTGTDSKQTTAEAKTEDPAADATEASSGEEEITLRIVDWSDSSLKRREEFNEQYMKDHPNIKIEYTMLTIDQFKNTIVTMIKSGDGPDLFPIPTGMTLSTALKEEWYQPLNPYVTEEFKESLNPNIFQEGITMHGEDWYIVPEASPVLVGLFYYNKDVLENAGVTELPKSYPEFIEACKKITETGNGEVYGLIEGGKQLNRLDILTRSMVAAAGGKIAPQAKVLTVDGRAPYDTKEVMEVMGLFEQLVKDGSVHPDTVNIGAPEARELFAQGQAGFLCQGMWCIAPWAQNYPDLNYGVMAFPTPDGETKGGIQRVELPPWMGLYKQSKHPKEAVEYLMALYSNEYNYQSGCVGDGNYISIVPEVNEKYMNNEIMKEYYDVAVSTSKEIPIATVRDEKAYDFYAEVKDVQPSLAAIVQGILSQSITDYESELKKLSDASTEEWKRASEAVGLDYNTFEFPNWDVTKDYTEEDYEALK
ncbi:MAG: ABC transporter substrate-binding protein [Lachnospiraceae bacterium]|jgi:multiple sugar transport system substrate-binding protein